MLLPSGAGATSADGGTLHSALTSGSLALLLMGKKTGLKIRIMKKRISDLMELLTLVFRFVLYFSVLFGSTSVSTRGGFSVREFMSTLQATFIRTVSGAVQMEKPMYKSVGAEFNN